MLDYRDRPYRCFSGIGISKGSPNGKEIKKVSLNMEILVCVSESPPQDPALVSRFHVIEITAGSRQNVKEHATLSAGASVDHGVEVETTGNHVNRTADRGCCVSPCSASDLLDVVARSMKSYTNRTSSILMVSNLFSPPHQSDINTNNDQDCRRQSKSRESLRISQLPQQQHRDRA